MAIDQRKTVSARVRERARLQRSELDKRRKQQDKVIEEHQLAFFAACDEIAAVNDKIEKLEAELAALKARQAEDTAAARLKAQTAMGALVVTAGQPIEDVAVLLDVDVAEVRRAKTAFTKSPASESDRSARAVSGESEPPDDEQDEAA